MASLPLVGKAHAAEAGAPFVWFVYASSLDRAAFADWCGQHGYTLPSFEGAFPARLRDHRLTFDVASRFWGGGVASVGPAAGEGVEGLCIPMPGDAKGLVEHKEGAISGLYEPFEATAEPLAGGAPVAVRVFRSAPSRRAPTELAPSRGFLEAVLRGARASGLSAAWISRLEADLGRAV